MHAKTSFSFAIVLGNLFADPSQASEQDERNVASLLNGDISVPLPTYFTVATHALPQPVVEALERNDDELCPNLYFLGKRSTTKTSEGLRIVSIGGNLNPDVAAGLSAEKYLPLHTESDVKSLRGANSADILITSVWPAAVRSKSNIPLPDGLVDPAAEQSISDLCSALKPRYLFSVSDQGFFEREPFLHLASEDRPDSISITRFISLAAFGNSSKQKWLYAFSIEPNAAAPSILPTGTTASPFSTNSRKRQRLPDQEDAYSRFPKKARDDHYRPTRRGRQPPPGPSECYFCLSNENLNIRLITSIANDTYLTNAKGPLSDAATFAGLGFPCHVQMIPLSHSPTFQSIPDPQVRSATFKEMHRYRRALHSLLIDSSKSSLGSVTWEISRASGVHVHWQFLPVPVDLIKRGLIEAAFKEGLRTVGRGGKQ